MALAPPLSRSMPRAAIAAVCLALATSLASCAEAESEDTSKKVDPNNMTVGVSQLGLNYPFMASVGEGIKAKAEELGVKLVELDSGGDAEKQGKTVQDLIAQQPDGVIILPVDSTVAVGMVDQMVDAGLPVVAVASQVGDPDERAVDDVYEPLVALVTQAETEAGRQAGELALQAAPNGGKLAIIEGKAGFAEVQFRSQEFLTPAKEAGVNFEIVAKQPGDWLVEGGESACQNILSGNPDIDLFYAQADDMAIGCAKAVKQAGSSASVIGIGGSGAGLDAVASGDVYGTVCFQPHDMGELGMQAMYDYLTGENEETGRFVTYDTPPIVKSNLDECEPQW